MKTIDFKTETLIHILTNGCSGTRPMFPPNVISRLDVVVMRLVQHAEWLNNKAVNEPDAVKSVFLYHQENAVSNEIASLKDIILLIGEFYTLDESKYMAFNAAYIENGNYQEIL